MAKIYAFPPVGLTGWRLAEERRVNRSAYALDGRRAVAGIGPARRDLDLTVSALSKDRAGAGYLNQLWRYIEGGVHLVRVPLPPENWHLDRTALFDRLGNYLIQWAAGADLLEWQSGADDLVWFRNDRLAVPITLDGYAHAVQVANLPPGEVVARPGDWLRVYAADGLTSSVARVVDLSRADGAGVATIPLASALPAGWAPGRCSIRARSGCCAGRNELPSPAHHPSPPAFMTSPLEMHRNHAPLVAHGSQTPGDGTGGTGPAFFRR
jgi:hypothetical protein